MLYGIAVVVIAAFVFLIVYNMKAAKSTKPQTAPNETERKTQANPDNRRSEAAPETNPHSAAAQQAGSGVQAASGFQAASERKPEAEPSPAPSAPLQQEAGYSRGTKISALHRQQSDDEYREALRSFSAKSNTEDTPKENKDEASKQSKDEAYREGLRSLTKRD